MVAMHKKQVRFNVISMRISDEEKLALEELTRRSQTTISELMREAMHSYTSKFEKRASRR